MPVTCPDAPVTSPDAGHLRSRAFWHVHSSQSTFGETEITSILKQGEAEVAIQDLCRRAGIRTATYDQWKSK